MRSTRATGQMGRVRDARMMVLPPLPLRSDVADDARSEREQTLAWWNEDEDEDGSIAAQERRLDDDLDNTLASLCEPEHEDILDLSISISPVAVTPKRSPVRPRVIIAEHEHTGMGRRIASKSVALAKARPVVRIPGRASGKTIDVDADTASLTRKFKLPPIWLLANVVILLMASIAVLPRIVPVDAASGCKWHTVAPGDTLGNLGWANHTSAMAIANANHIANPNLIFVGQNLCIPMTSWAKASHAPSRPSTAQPPSFGTARNVQSFIKLALPYAHEAHNQTGWPVSVILAQWGLEHGWSIPSFTGYNWGNSGAIPGFPTVAGTSVPGSPAAFAYARTPEDGVAIYVHCAQLSYYTAVAPAGRTYGADAAARTLGRSPWDAGHYTDHGDPGSSLLSIMRVYNLYWYDSH